MGFFACLGRCTRGNLPSNLCVCGVRQLVEYEALRAGLLAEPPSMVRDVIEEYVDGDVSGSSIALYQTGITGPQFDLLLAAL